MSKHGGIRRRWLRNNVLLMALAVIAGVFIFSLYSARYYVSAVQRDLERKAQTATDFFANYLAVNYAEYYQSAYKLTEEFDEKDKLELQFVDVSGKIQISSYGLTAGGSPGTPDITGALDTRRMTAWTGNSPSTGERIMAVSSPLIYKNGQLIGVMRYVTSLRVVDSAVLRSIGTAALVGVLVLAIEILTGVYFLRSIVAPIGEITGTARHIADGGYGVTIDKKFNDEIGEMADAITDMSVKIAQSEKIKSEFISSISHELRTPLTAISGWGETLYEQENLPDDTRKGINIIIKEARRLTTMVEGLLEFTRIEDGRFTLNVKKIDISEELEESIFTYGEILRQENMELEYVPYDGDMPLINGDGERLRQVFLNILDNAAKYGKTGKRIVVTIGLEPDWVVISVRDFGRGIPPEELPNVKLKFYKGSSKERGSGIGLSVCDEIVRLHKGQLIIENAEGGGVLVTVKLPTDEAKQ